MPSRSSSRHGSSPDRAAFTTIEFYHTRSPALPTPIVASLCKLLSDLSLFDVPQIRMQFKPLDSAIRAVLAATSSHTQSDACHRPSRSNTLYIQALFGLGQSKQCGGLPQDGWHNTAFTSLMLQLVEILDGANTSMED